MVSTFIGLLDIQSWWEIPCISHFCSLFSKKFNLPDIDIEDLETALLAEGTDDQVGIIPELIVRLLKGCDYLQTSHDEITTCNYQMFLRRFLRQQCRIHKTVNYFDTDIDFQSLPIRSRLLILHSLCHFRLESIDVEDILKNLEADSIRVEPLGYDSKNSSYWYFYGTRLYREDIKLGSKTKIWQVICFTEDDWRNLAGKLKKSTNTKERELYTILEESFLPNLPQLFRERERLRRRKLLQVRSSTRIRNNTIEKSRQVEQIEKDRVERETVEANLQKANANFRNTATSRRRRSQSQSSSSSSGISTYENSVRDRIYLSLAERRNFRNNHLSTHEISDSSDKETSRKSSVSRSRSSSSTSFSSHQNSIICNKSSKTSTKANKTSSIKSIESSDSSDNDSVTTIEDDKENLCSLDSDLDSSPETIIKPTEIIMAPTSNMKLPGRQTNNSLSSLTGNIFISPISGPDDPGTSTTQGAVNNGSSSTTDTTNSNRNTTKKGKQTVAGPSTSSTTTTRNKRKAKSTVKKKVSRVGQGANSRNNKVDPTTSKMLRSNESSTKKRSGSVSLTETEENINIGMNKIFVYVKNQRDAWPFMDPVEEDIAPRYYSIIRRPMDLLTIEDRLDNGDYKKFSEFRNDFKLIVNNCRLYNGQNNEYTQMVNNLQKAFDKASKKYFDHNSDDEDITYLGYLSDIKMNVFREKYFNRASDEDDSKKSVARSTNTGKTMNKKKDKRRHSGDCEEEGDKSMRAEEIDDDIEESRSNKRKRKEKDKRRKKKNKAKRSLMSDDDDDLDYDSSEDYKDNHRKIKRKKTESVSDNDDDSDYEDPSTAANSRKAANAAKRATNSISKKIARNKKKLEKEKKQQIALEELKSGDTKKDKGKSKKLSKNSKKLSVKEPDPESDIDEDDVGNDNIDDIDNVDDDVESPDDVNNIDYIDENDDIDDINNEDDDNSCHNHKNHNGRHKRHNHHHRRRHHHQHHLNDDDDRNSDVNAIESDNESDISMNEEQPVKNLNKEKTKMNKGGEMRKQQNEKIAKKDLIDENQASSSKSNNKKINNANKKVEPPARKRKSRGRKGNKKQSASKKLVCVRDESDPEDDDNIEDDNEDKDEDNNDDDNKFIQPQSKNNYRHSQITDDEDEDDETLLSSSAFKVDLHKKYAKCPLTDDLDLLDDKKFAKMSARKNNCDEPKASGSKTKAKTGYKNDDGNDDVESTPSSTSNAKTSTKNKTPPQSDVENSAKDTNENKKLLTQKNAPKKSKKNNKNNSSKNNTESDKNDVDNSTQQKDNDPDPPVPPVPPVPPPPLFLDKYDLIKQRRNRTKHSDDKWNQIVKQTAEKSKSAAAKNEKKEKNQKLRETIEKLKVKNAKSKQQSVLIDEIFGVKPTPEIRDKKAIIEKLRDKCEVPASVSGTKKSTPTATAVNKRLAKSEIEEIDLKNIKNNSIQVKEVTTKKEKKTKAEKNFKESNKDSCQLSSNKREKKSSSRKSRQSLISKNQFKHKSSACATATTATITSATTSVITAIPSTATVITSTVTSGTVEAPTLPASNLVVPKATVMEALELETEQTLKDINRWLECTPRFTEFSSASNSPSRYSLLEDFEAVSTKIEDSDFHPQDSDIAAQIDSVAIKNIETFQSISIEPEPKINKRKMSLPEKKRAESPAVISIRAKSTEITSSASSSCGTPPHSVGGGSINANASSSSSSTPPCINSPIHSGSNTKVKELTTQLITNPPPPPNIKAIQQKEAKRKSLKDKLIGTPNSRRKDLMGTIERLKPGKTKGNLIQAAVKPEENPAQSTVIKIKEIKNSLVVKTNENGPKLSLGSVLNTEKFGLSHTHNFAEKHNSEDSNIIKSINSNPPIVEEFRREVECRSSYKQSMHGSPHEDSNNSFESLRDDKSTDSFPRGNTKMSNTPNFSAWFKAFGGKKKKKLEEDEGKLVDNNDYSHSITSPPNDMMGAIRFNTIKSPNNNYSMSGIRQRKASTGSTISERSSFSQDPDSPRIGIDERFGTYPGAYTSPIGASPIGASPIMVSPKPEDIGKPNSPYPLNGAIKVGFYQDTTTKSSPEKSCSPRELPSPYQQYSQHIYTSGSSPNVSASEMSGSSPYGGHSYNPTSNEPHKTPVYQNTSPIPNQYEHYKQPHSQESDYNSSMSPSTPNPHSPYPQPQLSPYHQSQHSPYQQASMCPNNLRPISPPYNEPFVPPNPSPENGDDDPPEDDDSSSDSSTNNGSSSPSTHHTNSTPSPVQVVLAPSVHHLLLAPNHQHLILAPSARHSHSTPSPHHSHSTPSPHHSHSTPSPHHSHSTPSPHHSHSTPSPHHSHSTPSPHHSHSTPSPHNMRSTPPPHNMRSTPPPHNMHSPPPSHNMHSPPPSHNMHSPPPSHNMHSPPPPHYMHSPPSPHNVHSTPSPQPPQHSPLPFQQEPNKPNVQQQHSPYHQASSPYQPLQVATSPYSNPSSPYQHQAPSPAPSSNSPTHQQLSPIHYNRQHPNSPPAISPPIIPLQQQSPPEHTAYERQYFNYQHHSLQSHSHPANHQNMRSMYDEHSPSPEIVRRTASVLQHSGDWQKNQGLLSTNNSPYSSSYHHQYTSPPNLIKETVDLPDTKHYRHSTSPSIYGTSSDVSINLSQHRSQAHSHHLETAHPLPSKTVISSTGNMKRPHTDSESDLISLGYSSNEISSALSNKLAKRDDLQQIQPQQSQQSQSHHHQSSLQQQPTHPQPPMKSYEAQVNKHQQMFDSFLGSMAGKNLVSYGKPLDISATKALEVFNHAATIGFPKDFPTSLINSAVNKDLHHQSLQQQSTSLQHHLQNKIMETAQLNKPLNMVNSGNGSYNLSPNQHHQQSPHKQQQQVQLIYGNPKAAHSQSTQIQQQQQHSPPYPTNLAQSASLEKQGELIIPNPRQEQQLSNHLTSFKYNEPIRNLNHSLASMLDETMLISNTTGVGFYDKSMPPAAHMFSSGKNLSQQMYHNTSSYGSAVAAAAAAAREQQNPPAPGNYVPTVSVHNPPVSGGLSSSSHPHHHHHHSVIESPQSVKDTKPAKKPRKKKAAAQNTNESTPSSGSSGIHNSSVQNMMLGSLGVGQTSNQMHHLTHHSQLQAQPAHQITSQAQTLHQGFQLYAGLKTAGISSASTSSTSAPTVSSPPSGGNVTPISLKTGSATSMVPGSAFNFGPSPPGLGLPSAIYGDNTTYLDDYRGPPNPYYMPTSHRSSSGGDGSITKSGNGNSSSAVAAAAAAAAANPYQFLTHASTRTPYPFINSAQIDPNSPFYQQYMQRQDELRSRMILNPAILGPPPPTPTSGYPQPSFRPPLGLPTKHPYDINRQTWF